MKYLSHSGKAGSVILTGFFMVFLLSGCHSKLLTKEGGKKLAPANSSKINLPYNKILQPAGKMIFFGDSALENHALDVVLSPDGKYAAIEGRYSIVIMDTGKDTIIFRLSVRDNNLHTMNTYSGIQWMNLKGKSTLFWGTRNDVIRAVWDNLKLRVTQTYHFDPEGRARASLPNEILSGNNKDHPVLYIVLNGNDRLAKLDLATGKVLWEEKTGLAPYGIIQAAGRLYVTNWAGMVPAEDTIHTAGIPWGKARVDSVTGVVNSGSVSVLDPENGKIICEIPVGLHPNDLVSSPGGEYVYVANGNDDYISVIHTGTNKVVEKISVRLLHENNPYFGDSPNGLVLSADGKTLYVSNGMDNAIAVIHLGKDASATGTDEKSAVTGFIPTGAYPGGIALLQDKKIYVANIEGVGARLTVKNQQPGYRTTVNGDPVSTAGYYNAHRMLATVSVIPVPDKKQLSAYTRIVRKTNRLDRIKLDGLLPRKNRKPVPLPERIGEPSVFKHVVYIIKENRTYDQVLGDIKQGDGLPYLCSFGEKVTPNTHKLVKAYGLLDRYEASGKCSAEGHLWTDASIVTDYIEKNVRAWFRSYTHVLYDAMAYPKTGFLWDNALDHGKSVRIYGEAAVPVDYGNKKWADIYHEFMNGVPIAFKNHTTIDRVRGILSPGYPAYDSHNFPDIMRARAFTEELHAFEKMKGDQFPSLCIMALPNDHTAGTSPGHPTPRAMVADNDLALGRIIEALSKSRFWKNTVVFVTEDDSQAGWDHVSAYRTVALVISPYSRLKKTISTAYNQTSMIRTIEQILGLPPMNVEDATAIPMRDVFTKKPDFSPYICVKNNIPLDEMNPPLSALNQADLYYAKASARLAEKGIDAAGEDDLMNRILWHSFRENRPYPKQ